MDYIPDARTVSRCGDPHSDKSPGEPKIANDINAYGQQRRGRPYTKVGNSGPGGKRAVVALVERGGNLRSFHVASADKETVNTIVLANIARESRLHG